MDSEIFSRIRDYLADQLEVEPEKITPDSDIVNDFGADSLDVIDMITTLSDEFGVEKMCIRDRAQAGVTGEPESKPLYT